MRVILSAGAMLIFSVFLRVDRVPFGGGKGVKVIHIVWVWGVGAWVVRWKEGKGREGEGGECESCHVTGFLEWEGGRPEVG